MKMAQLEESLKNECSSPEEYEFLKDHLNRFLNGLLPFGCLIMKVRKVYMKFIAEQSRRGCLHCKNCNCGDGI